EDHAGKIAGLLDGYGHRPAAIRTGNGSGFMAAILPGRATPRPPEDCVSNRIGRGGRGRDASTSLRRHGRVDGLMAATREVRCAAGCVVPFPPAAAGTAGGGGLSKRGRKRSRG